MRILTRYILREVVSHALIGAAVFTFVLFTRDLGRILELVVRNSAPLPSVAEVFFFTVPVALTYTIPMGVLVGILIGLSRLAADSEITAMRASGLGVWTFLRVISIFVVVAWLLALGNSVYIAPRSLAALGQLQDNLKSSQASFEVQPRVFYEGFPKIILYVQDVKAMSGGALWKGVFLADLTDPAAPRISLARQGLLVSQGPDTLDLHLTDGSTHETDPKNPDQYQISTFQTTDIPIRIPATQNSQEHEPTTLGEIKFADLLRSAQTGDPVTRRWHLIEYHRRLALPTACIVLALVGIPLGLSSKKGGKSSGFVLTILLVFLYYSLSLIGVSFAKQGRLSPAAGVWLADLAFLAGGVFLLWQSDRRPIELASFRAWFKTSRFKTSTFRSGRTGTAADAPSMLSPTALHRNGESSHPRSLPMRRRWFNLRFPTILDDYVLRDFALYLTMIVAAFLMLLLVFTLFELLSDILRNQVSPLTVGEYLLNVVPYFLYNTTPLSMLLAVLVTFGLLQKSNEITRSESGFAAHRGRISVERGALFSVQHHAPQHVAGGACDLRPAAEVERDHRHQGHRHQSVPHHRPRVDRLPTLRRRALPLRPTLSPLHQQAAGRAPQPHQGQARANLPAPRAPVDVRPALRHLLLSILRSRPQCFRGRLRVPVRPAHFPDHASHHRRPRALVRLHGQVGLRTGMGAQPERRHHRELPQVRCRNLP